MVEDARSQAPSGLFVVKEHRPAMQVAVVHGLGGALAGSGA